MARRKKMIIVAAFASYPIKIVAWRANYSFSLNKSKRLNDNLYSEYTRLEIDGVFLAPEKVRGKQVSITLLLDREFDRALTEPMSINWATQAIGGLSSRGKKSDYIGSLPFQAFPSILALLSAGKTECLLLSGEALFRGKAKIDFLQFCESCDPDDYL